MSHRGILARDYRALLILLAIVCAYSWLAYRIKTSAPDINPTVPKPRD